MLQSVLVAVLFICGYFTNAIAAVISTGNGEISIDDYTLDHLSIQNYPATNAPLVVYNPSIDCPTCIDGCIPYELSEVPDVWRNASNGSIAIVLTASYCEVTKAVSHVIDLNDQLKTLQGDEDSQAVRIVGVIQLFDPYSDAVPNDETIRYTRDPIALREKGGLIVHRAKDQDAGIIFRNAMGCDFKDGDVSASSTCYFPNDGNIPNLVLFPFQFTPSPWLLMYTGVGWASYAVFGLFMWFSMLVFTVVSLLTLRARNKGKARVYGSASNLQTTSLATLLTLSTVRTTDFLITVIRDLSQTWVPEAIGQIVWIWGYMLSVASLMILALYWGELLRTTSRKLTTLSQPSKIVMYSFFSIYFLLTTLLMLLFSFRVTSFYWAFQFLLTGSLAIIGMGSAIAMLVYGRRILKRLGSNNNDLELSIETSGQRQRLVSKIKKMRPLTRLIMLVSSLVLALFLLTAFSVFSPILKRTGTPYVILFYALLCTEFGTAFSTAFTVSPLRKSNRGNTGQHSKTATRGNSSFQLSAQAEQSSSRVLTAHSTKGRKLSVDDEMPPI